MIYLRRHVRAGRYTIVGTSRSHYCAHVVREGDRWRVSIKHLPSGLVAERGKYTWRTAKQASRIAKATLEVLHEVINETGDHMLWSDLTKAVA